MCRERVCFSSSKCALGTWPLCPGPTNKLKFSAAAWKRVKSPHWGSGWTDTCQLLLPLGCVSPGAHHAVGLRYWLCLELFEIPVSKGFGKAACLMRPKKKKAPYPLVWVRSGNVHPEGSGTTQERRMLHNQISPSPEVYDSRLCSCVISAVYKEGGCLESQHSEG